MKKIISLSDSQNKILKDIQNCITQIRHLAESDIETVKRGIVTLRNIRNELYEDLNQIQHEEMILRAIKYLQENEFHGMKIGWYWNPRQTGNAGEPDLRGQKNNRVIISAEITTSERPKGTIDKRMQTTLKRLNEMDGRKYYFVRTSAMERRALTKIRKSGYVIEVKRI